MYKLLTMLFMIYVDGKKTDHNFLSFINFKVRIAGAVSKDCFVCSYRQYRLN